MRIVLLMNKSTQSLDTVLSALTGEARRLALNDSQWAQAAGVRKETLSRLRKRKSCDFATLHALASVVGAQIGVTETQSLASTSEAHFPASLNRAYEARLLDLCASGDLDLGLWRRLGPPFFVAGIAVMLASRSGFDRLRLLALAETLHPGSSQPEVFALWLKRSPLRPARFLPLLAARAKRAA